MSDYLPTLAQTSNILWTRPSMTSDITANHLAVSKIFSFNGTIETSKRYVDGIGMSIKCNFSLSRVDMDGLYSFWGARKGSYSKFYVPLRNTYFSLTQNVSANDTIIYTSKIPYAQNWLVGTYLYWEMKNGDRIVKKVITVADSGNTEIITLDSGLPYNFTQADVGFFSRFILVHFASDDFEIEYFAGADLLQTSLIFNEIKALDTETNIIHAELYTIETALNTSYYTSYYKDLVYSNNTYLASVMERDEINYSLDISDNNNLNLTVFPTPYIQQNIFNQTLSKVNISIQRIDLISNTITTLYKGHIVGIAMNGDTAILTLNGLDEELNFNLPHIIYQSTCNNQLFDKKCKVVSSNYSIISVVSAVSGNDVTSVNIATQVDGYWTLGYATYKKEYRFITSHTGQTITLLRPFSEDVTNKTITVYAGCNKSAPVCASKFNNITNFLGFYYIPNKNPSLWGLK